MNSQNGAITLRAGQHRRMIDRTAADAVRVDSAFNRVHCREHIVGELMKGFMLKREVKDERIPEELSCKLQGALPSISLVSQTGVLSAFINDVAPDMMYAQLVYGYGRKGDLLICLSTSGNSKNCVNAAEVAKCIGINVLSLTGEKESRLSEISDCTVKVPEIETFKVQEYHLPVYHYLCAMTENYFFEK